MVSIALSNSELSVVRQALLECYGGYASDFLPAFLGVEHTTLETLAERIKNHANQDPLNLDEKEWRLIYEAINAVIHELGPEELQTLTGCSLKEILNTGSTIFSTVNGRRKNVAW